jgi:hypothetical protein
VTGASITFWRIVRWAQRLNCWNTIDRFVRMRVTCARSAGWRDMPVALPADGLAFEDDLALLAVLEQVRAAQERGLARPGGSDERHDVPTERRHVHALQDLERAEALVEVPDFDDGRRIGSQVEPVMNYLRSGIVAIPK